MCMWKILSHVRAFRAIDLNRDWEFAIWNARNWYFKWPIKRPGWWWWCQSGCFHVLSSKTVDRVYLDVVWVVLTVVPVSEERLHFCTRLCCPQILIRTGRTKTKSLYRGFIAFMLSFYSFLVLFCVLHVFVYGSVFPCYLSDLQHALCTHGAFVADWLRLSVSVVVECYACSWRGSVKGRLSCTALLMAPFPIVHFDIRFSLFSRYFQFFEQWLTRLFFSAGSKHCAISSKLIF